MAKLTAKQQRFVEEYLIDLNATQAAIRAGYSKKTAKEVGCQNLTKLNIQEEIQKKIKNREKRTEITQDRVLKELAAIAFAKVSDFVIIDDWGHVELTQTEALSEDNKKALAGIKETKFGINVETYDKTKALELLGRHLGMFKDKIEVSGEVNNPFETLTTEELKVLIGNG